MKNITNISDLELGKYYQVWEQGPAEWYDGYEYVGHDVNTDGHIFRTIVGPFATSFYFMSVSRNDVLDMVRFAD
jgi:hypothetical protein